MTITTELLICSATDSAIDVSRSDLQAYAKTKDLQHLSFKEGETPVLFLVKRISTEMLLRLKEYAKGDRSTNRYLCFLTACTSYKQGDVEHSATLLANTTVAEDKWIDELREEFGFEIVEELVDVSYKFQTLSKRNPYFL